MHTKNNSEACLDTVHSRLALARSAMIDSTAITAHNVCTVPCHGGNASFSAMTIGTLI